MKSPLLLLLVLCVCAAAETAPPKAAPGEVEITAEPFHHLVLKNKKVRVFSVEVPPKASTLMHRHRNDYLFVTLGDSLVRNQRQGEKPAELRLEDGDVRFTKGGFAHIATNLADSPFRNVTIEVLKPARGIVRLATCDVNEGIECGFCDVSPEGKQKCEWPGATKTLPELEKKEQEKDYGVYQFVVHLHPGSATGMHMQKADYLLVAVSNLELKNDVQGKPEEILRMKAGEVRWVKGGSTHSLTNLGKQPAWSVSFEFK
jgi:quercetin dioxygenase-like cupin family protein